MSACTFFGHRDCPSSIKPKLREVLIDLIENHAVDMFYVGQQGAFAKLVKHAFGYAMLCGSFCFNNSAVIFCNIC